MASPNLHPLPSLLSLVLLLSYPCLSTSAKCHRDDRKALLAIKSFWGNPVRLSKWGTTPYGCCEWGSVACDSTGRVVNLLISGDHSINGTMPPSIADLPFLRSIHFAELPNLVGPIIPAISRLTKLAVLSLVRNGLSGPIPSFLATMPNLEVLDLSSNRLSGSIPPELSSIKKLISLNLDNNDLTGSIPDSFGKFSARISLSFSGNKLTGPVPKSLSTPDLAALDLSRNKLSGDPSFLFHITNLHIIYLSRNMFEFDLSKVVFSKNLSLLDVSHNKIYGNIPPQLAEVPYLSQLNVSYNRLCGKIPTGGNLGQFDQSVYVHNKCLCGTPMPPCK